jgi:predicted deacylase
MSRKVVKHFEVGDFPVGEQTPVWVEMVADGLGSEVMVPLIVARGRKDGPVLGLTAALHGNELNGISVIHRVLQGLDLAALHGTVLAVPVANVPGYIANRREFNDGQDLNRIMPGREGGKSSDVYAARLLDRIVRHFDRLVDLHTASFGRINSLYVRADMTDPETRWMAEAQPAQIILHNDEVDGTLRRAATELGAPTITVEVGNPQVLQGDLVGLTVAGVRNIMHRLHMAPPVPVPPIAFEPVLCSRSYWIYTDRGGVLEVFPKLTTHVEAGERIAQVRSIHGRLIRDIYAPESGIVIGKSVNPVNQTGSRVLHLGILGDPLDGGERGPTATDE